jgi:hypothetical protein
MKNFQAEGLSEMKSKRFASKLALQRFTPLATFLEARGNNAKWVDSDRRDLQREIDLARAQNHPLVIPGSADSPQSDPVPESSEDLQAIFFGKEDSINEPLAIEAQAVELQKAIDQDHREAHVEVFRPINGDPIEALAKAVLENPAGSEIVDRGNGHEHIEANGGNNMSKMLGAKYNISL